MKFKFFNIIFYFGFPEFQKVTIFNHMDYWLRRLIFKNNKKIITIPSLPYVPIFLSFKFLIYLFNHLNKLKNLNIRSNFKKFYYFYIISILDYSRTKVVVTFIDNSGVFHNLNKYDNSTNRKYFAIQNGARHVACAKTSLPKGYKINLKNFFCFGKRDIDLFKKYSHKIKNFYPVGNIKSSFFFSNSNNKNNKLKKIYDICFISQWRDKFDSKEYDNKIEKKVFKENKNSITILVQFLRKLTLKNDYKIIVCLRSNEREEIEYYKNKLKGINFTLIFGNTRRFSTFKTILKSELTIALNSTALSEVFGISKVLWANILNNKNFEMPEAGISYFKENNFIKFKNRVEYLMKLDIHKYKKIIKKKANYICMKNFKKPSHLLIRKKIKEEMSNV